MADLKLNFLAAFPYLNKSRFLDIVARYQHEIDIFVDSGAARVKE